MGKVESEAEAIYDKLGRGAATDVKTIGAALLAAEKRGREEAAKIAAGNSAEFDFQKALAECRDSEHGFHSGRLHAAAAIRSGS